MAKSKKAEPALKKRTVKLKHPIQLGEDLLEELELYPPTARELEDLPLQNQRMKDLYQIASKCSRQPYSTIRKLHADDISEVVGVINDFLGVGQQTGTDA